jgi:hypothetical protein
LVNNSRTRKKNAKMAHRRELLRITKQRVVELEQRGAPAKKKIAAGTLNLYFMKLCEVVEILPDRRRKAQRTATTSRSAARKREMLASGLGKSQRPIRSPQKPQIRESLQQRWGRVANLVPLAEDPVFNFEPLC